MREQFLLRIASLAERRPLRVLAVAALVTLGALWQMSQLELLMHFKNLMPQNHPMVQEFNRIVDDFSSASQIIVTAIGQEEDLKRFADEVAPRIEMMTQHVRRVDYRLERDFFLQHGFMLQKARDLANSRGLFSDLNLLPWLGLLNDSFEKTYVYDEESISTRQKEQRAIAFLDGIEFWLAAVTDYVAGGDAISPDVATAAAERFLLGDEYLISQDKDVLLIFAQPTFTLSEIDRVVAAEDAIDALIHQVAGHYPGLEAGTTGTMALARDEMVAFEDDAFLTSLVAFVLIIGLFVLSFRMWVAPLMAGITLIVGIIWTGAFAALVIGSLNIMTSMFSVILLGLGVDFSIHVISGYTENRAAGLSIGDSLQHMLRKSGSGIIIGAITTACAFLTLTVSETAGMREFGLVAGAGVLLCMLAALLVLPALLSWRDQFLAARSRKPSHAPPVAFTFLSALALAISRRSIPVLVAGTAATAFLLHAALQITFDYNYLNMEPVGLTSVALQDRMEEEFDVTPDFALVTTSSVEEARGLAAQAKDLKMVGMVTSISDYIPSPAEQEKRRPLIQAIRRDLEQNRTMVPFADSDLDPMVDELYRLEDNIVELAQLAFLGGQDKVDAKSRQLTGDLEAEDRHSLVANLVEALGSDRPRAGRRLDSFQQHFEPTFRRLALGMASTAPIHLDDLPTDIVDRFANHDRTSFLVAVYPREGVWKNLEFLERFTRRMQDLDERTTGFVSIFYILIGIIAADGKLAAGLTLLVVFLLLWADFRNLRFVLLAMLPLVVGAIWMVGIMHLCGLQLTLLNVIGVPLILGIGVDDGVHLLHRYRLEGPGHVDTVFLSTGKAVLLTSLTTMLAFGSLKFATYRGLGSMGMALFIGVGACFLTSVLLLPALLGWMERNRGMRND